MSKQTLAVLLAAIAAVVILAVLVDTIVLPHARQNRPPRTGWTDINYDIERLPIEGGWLYRDRTRGRFVFVPGAPV